MDKIIHSLAYWKSCEVWVKSIIIICIHQTEQFQQGFSCLLIYWDHNWACLKHIVSRFLWSSSSLNCSSACLDLLQHGYEHISSSCFVYVHFSYQSGPWPSPHVNQSTRWRLFTREIIIVRNVRGRNSLIIFLLPCRTIKRSHSGREICVTKA